MKTYYICGALAVLALSACTDSNSWGVKGNIANAGDDAILAIEANNAGHWYTIDSVEIKSNGDFEYIAGAPYQGRNIMRITLPGKGSIYFPVDSIDQITVTADAASFGNGKISGTPLAEGIARVDSIVAATDDKDILSRELINVMTGDTTGLISYYALGKSVMGEPVFNPTESLGNRAYGAVAQVYANHRPDDPLGKAVERAYFEGRMKLGKMPVRYVEVPETGFVDIVRYDARGKEQKLSDIAKDKVVLLSFAQYDLPATPAINSMLMDLYTKYNSKGLEIYQLAFDNDEVSWREAARNLPWTAVWNAPTDGPDVLAHYNISSLPVFYIINRNGDLVERIEKPAEVSAKVARQF